MRHLYNFIGVVVGWIIGCFITSKIASSFVGLEIYAIGGISAACLVA